MKKYFAILFFLSVNFLFAGNLDSLLKLATTKARDTAKVSLLNTIARETMTGGNATKAQDYAQQALGLADSLQFFKGQFQSYYLLAEILRELGNRTKSIELLIKALKLAESSGDKNFVAQGYLNLGFGYFYQVDYPMALKNYYTAMHIASKSNFERTRIKSYGNIAMIHTVTARYDSALFYYRKTLAFYEKNGPKNMLASQYANIGVLMWNTNKHNEALSYFNKSLQAQKELGNTLNQITILMNIGGVYADIKQFDKGIPFLLEALKIAEATKSKNKAMYAHQALALAYRDKNDFLNALKYLELYTELKDSIMHEGNNKNIEEMQTRFDTEKKEKEIQLLQKDKNIRELQMSEQQANINRQRIVIYSVAGGLALILTLIFFIWKSYREKKKINTGLELKNTEINLQKNLIEGKNLLITDSIDYARNIQNAILPSDETIHKNIQDSFILFMPKDIVSGDFYFMKPIGDSVFIASVDCTGHGVPGAFMSVMAFNMLENILADKKLLQPALILDELNKMVLETLHQETENSSAKYGMDISLIAIDKKQNKIEFAGAHNPLCIVRDSKLMEIKADKTTIGMAKEKFTNHVVEVQKNDMLYMFTDGYPDQKGGPQNKKFFVSEFKNLLASISKNNSLQQKEILYKTFTDWKSSSEQIDDVLVIGIRL